LLYNCRHTDTLLALLTDTLLALLLQAHRHFTCFTHRHFTCFTTAGTRTLYLLDSQTLYLLYYCRHTDTLLALLTDTLLALLLQAHGHFTCLTHRHFTCVTRSCRKHVRVACFACLTAARRLSAGVKQVKCLCLQEARARGMLCVSDCRSTVICESISHCFVSFLIGPPGSPYTCFTSTVCLLY
jgi:hypothetical protein